MPNVDLHEAERKLEQLIELAQAGEEVRWPTTFDELPDDMAEAFGMR